MGATPLAPTRVTVQDLTAFCLEAMRRAGLNDEDAQLTAEVLVSTDTLGTFTHGTRQGLHSARITDLTGPRLRQNVTRTTYGARHSMVHAPAPLRKY